MAAQATMHKLRQIRRKSADKNSNNDMETNA